MAVEDAGTGADAPTIVELSPEDARRISADLNRPEEAHKADKLLQVRGLSTHFFTPDGVVQAVDEVSFDVDYGETLGLVGESGCGKSVTACPWRVSCRARPGGSSRGRSCSTGSTSSSSATRTCASCAARRSGCIFQDPLTSLNPTLTIGYQIAETIREHLGIPRKAGEDAGGRAPGQGRHPEAQGTAQRLPAPASPAACGSA